MCVFGATMLCCFCFFIVLVVFVVILLVVMYSFGHMNPQNVINGICSKYSAVQRDRLPSEILQSADHLLDKKMGFELTDDVTDNETMADHLQFSMFLEEFEYGGHNMLIPYTPVILEMLSFTEKIESKQDWFSSSFLAFEGGYRIRLMARINGDNTHVSVYLQLLKGPYDEILQQSGHFPMYGYFIVELLHKAIDISHHIRVINPDGRSCSDCTNRVTENIGSRWLGISNFASIKSINNHYLNNDSLQFKVIYTKYSCYSKALVFCKHDIFIILMVAVIDTIMVYPLLTLVEFIAFCIQEFNILNPRCINFSFGSINKFLKAKHKAIRDMWYVAFSSTFWLSVRYHAVSVVEIIFLSVGEFMFWDVHMATTADNVLLIHQALERFRIVVVFSLIVSQYLMSWGGKIVMINPFWLHIVISSLVASDY